MGKKLLFCLIIDDEYLAQQVLETYMQRISELRLVAKCGSVEDAFDMIASKQIDVIFLDLDLNRGSGTDIIKRIKQSSKNLYYVIITSAASPKQLQKELFNSERILLIDYLTKPFSFERFSESIHKIITLFEKQ